MLGIRCERSVAQLLATRTRPPQRSVVECGDELCQLGDLPAGGGVKLRCAFGI